MVLRYVCATYLVELINDLGSQIRAHFEAGEDARALDLIRRTWGYMLHTNISVQSTLLEGFTANGSLAYVPNFCLPYMLEPPSYMFFLFPDIAGIVGTTMTPRIHRIAMAGAPAQPQR